MKKIVKFFNIAIIIITMILSGLLIGTPMKENNVQIIYVISSIFAISYFLIKIIKKEKIELNKIDICVCILAFSTLIPIIFKTYASLSDAVLVSIEYISILNLYLIIKNECKKETRYINVIINIIIISILLLCCIGFDEINFNYLEDLKEKIGYVPFSYDEVRICSLFSYPNAMAIVAASGFFLCVGAAFRSKKIIIKLLYIIASLIMLVTLFFTYSRLVYIVFILVCLIYALFLFKKYNIKEKINRKVIYCTIVILIGGIIYILIGLQVSKNVEIEDSYQKILYEVDSNTDYIFNFEVSDNSEKIENFKISFLEKNKYFDDINTTVINLKEAGMQEIKIHTTDTTAVIYLNIDLEEDVGKLIIDDAYMNNERFILQYRLLPTGIVNKIQSISLNNKSAWERLAFIKDATKVIKENWIFGLGGNAWRKVQTEVQEYNYFASEVHCFPIQVFLEFGIVGFIACIGIIIFVLKKLYKEFKSKEINMESVTILISILTILLHSFLDFDMSNYYVFLITFVMIAILSLNEKKQDNISKKKIISIIISIILIILSILSLYVSSIEIYYRRQKDINKLTEKKVLNIYSNLLFFDVDVKERKYNALQRVENKDYEEIQKTIENFIETEKYSYRNIVLIRPYDYIESAINCNNLTEDKIDFILKYIEDTQEFYKYSIFYKMIRYDSFVKIYDILINNNQIEYAEKIKEALVTEITKNKEYILDYEKYREEKSSVGRHQILLDEIINKINEE